MRAYEIAVFFAILGAMTGVIEGIMPDGEGNWFPGTEAVQHNITNNLTEDDMEALAVSEQSYSTTETLSQEFDVFSVGIKALKGIFGITGFVEDAMFGKGDGDMKTAFHPIMLVIQGGIYIIYAMGLIQLWRKTPMQGAY